MKTKIFKHAAIVLLLAGSVASCAKRGESSGDVPYKPCPCDEGKTMKEILIKESLYIKETGYLFKDSIPLQFWESVTYSVDSSYDLAIAHLYCIIFDSKTNIACLLRSGNMSVGLGKICNFPDFAIDWDISENGYTAINFIGTMYEPCKHTTFQQCCGFRFPEESPDNYSWFSFDFILTNLKRK